MVNKNIFLEIGSEAHNPKVVGSNPAPATNYLLLNIFTNLNLFFKQTIYYIICRGIEQTGSSLGS